MPEITFRTVASGIVDRLTDQLDYLKTCRFYAGEVEDVSLGMPFESPAAFVMFDTKTPLSESFDSVVERSSFLVVLVARSVEGRADLTEGGAYSAHQMIEDAETALTGDDLGLDGFEGLTLGVVRRFRITTTQAIYTLEAAAMTTRSK